MADGGVSTQKKETWIRNPATSFTSGGPLALTQDGRTTQTRAWGLKPDFLDSFPALLLICH